MPLDRKAVIEQMLQSLEAPVKELTKWEENFLESIADQFQQKGSLSDRQFEILDKIYGEKT